MNAADQFDEIAKSYDDELRRSLGAAGNDIEIFARYKVKTLHQIINKSGKSIGSILEFGCGTGRNLVHLSEYFGDCALFGCDVSEESLAVAEYVVPSVKYQAIHTPQSLVDTYRELDLVFVCGVFHHIPTNEHQKWMDGLHATLKKGGILVLFEHNPFNPLSNYIFRHSKIDEGAVMVKPSSLCELVQNAGFCNSKLRYTLFFLWRSRWLEAVEKGLFWLPLGAQYYVCCEKT